ncbi:MAG: ribosome silencing factor [Deltaproteobacteria bacterium]|jgi:ribosome-associated protein|nr:ribosome silencing factor [Deltaproteobacteria bacterium]
MTLDERSYQAENNVNDAPRASTRAPKPTIKSNARPVTKSVTKRATKDVTKGAISDSPPASDSSAPPIEPKPSKKARVKPLGADQAKTVASTKAPKTPKFPKVLAQAAQAQGRDLKDPKTKAKSPVAKAKAIAAKVKTPASKTRPRGGVKPSSQARDAAKVAKVIKAAQAESSAWADQEAREKRTSQTEKPSKLKPRSRGKKSLARPTGRALADLVVKAAQEHKIQAPILLDLRGLSSVADWFFIASGENSRQIRAAAEKIVQRSLEAGIKPLGQEGLARGEIHWALVDLGDVVAHIFNAETRVLYDLEGLWADAPRG